MSKLSLKISDYQSTLSGLETIENVPLDILNALIDSDLIRDEQELTELKNLKKKVLRERLKVSYKQADYKFGRNFAVKSLSLGCKRRIIRHTLMKNLYQDIDMVNCHATILQQLCKSNEIACPQLDEYINNRDELLQAVKEEYTVDRDQAKKLFIILLFYGTFDTWKKDEELDETIEPSKYIIALTNELKTIGNTIIVENPKEVKLCEKLKKKNPKGSVVSLLLQSIEDHILGIIYDKLGRPKNVILSFDGLAVLLSDFPDINLKDIEEEITNKTNFKMELIIKELSHAVDPTTLKPEESLTLKNDLMAIHFERLNREYAKIKSVEAFAYKSWDGEIKFMTKSALINEEMDCAPMVRIMKFNNTKSEEVLQEVRIIDEWLLSCNKPKFLDIGIYPHDQECPTTHYNTWTPFLASTYEECPEDECIDELEFLLNHMLILCNHEEVIYNYFIRWFGQMLKYPSTKTNAPTFISEEGAGKGSLFELFRRVLGDSKVLETTKPDLVLGQFNDLLVNAFLVIFNEIERKQLVEYAGSLKAFITDKSVQINGKGKKSFKMLSLHRALSATNSETGGAINPHINDRRNVIIRCSDELCNNVEYFKKFYSIINNKQVIRKFYDYCYNLDGLETLELPPKTEHHKILIGGNVCHVKEFMKENVFSWSAQNIEDKEIMPITLYNDFKSYIESNGFKYETNTVHLSRKIGLLKIPHTKGKSKGSRCIRFNVDELITYFGLVRNEECKLIVEESVVEDNEPQIKLLDKIVLDRPTNMLVLPKDTKEFVNAFIDANAYDDIDIIDLLLM
jgi:hypothetical protein